MWGLTAGVIIALEAAIYCLVALSDLSAAAPVSTVENGWPERARLE
jgi:hypothetical protein